MVSKFFPELLKLMGEIPTGPSYIDLLNHLEKIGLIESTEFWKELRRTRNFVSHEYPGNPDLAASHLNTIHEKALALVTCWDSLLKNPGIKSLG
jgi:hypothetical protein